MTVCSAADIQSSWQMHLASALQVLVGNPSVNVGSQDHETARRLLNLVFLRRIMVSESSRRECCWESHWIVSDWRLRTFSSHPLARRRCVLSRAANRGPVRASDKQRGNRTQDY